MAFQTTVSNETIRKTILMLIALPLVASSNIDCGGKAFHCVNSTHFMICVDLGGGVSSTIDNFIIPCPSSTVCQETNHFECEFPQSTTVLPITETIVPSELGLSEFTTVTETNIISTTTNGSFSDVQTTDVTLNTVSITTTLQEDSVTTNKPVTESGVIENIVTDQYTNIEYILSTTPGEFTTNINTIDTSTSTTSDSGYSVTEAFTPLYQDAAAMTTVDSVRTDLNISRNNSLPDYYTTTIIIETVPDGSTTETFTVKDTFDSFTTERYITTNNDMPTTTNGSPMIDNNLSDANNNGMYQSTTKDVIDTTVGTTTTSINIDFGSTDKTVTEAFTEPASPQHLTEVANSENLNISEGLVTTERLQSVDLITDIISGLIVTEQYETTSNVLSADIATDVSNIYSDTTSFGNAATTESIIDNSIVQKNDSNTIDINTTTIAGTTFETTNTNYTIQVHHTTESISQVGTTNNYNEEIVINNPSSTTDSTIPSIFTTESTFIGDSVVQINSENTMDLNITTIAVTTADTLNTNSITQEYNTTESISQATTDTNNEEIVVTTITTDSTMPLTSTTESTLIGDSRVQFTTDTSITYTAETTNDTTNTNPITQVHNNTDSLSQGTTTNANNEGNVVTTITTDSTMPLVSTTESTLIGDSTVQNNNQNTTDTSITDTAGTTYDTTNTNSITQVHNTTESISEATTTNANNEGIVVTTITTDSTMSLISTTESTLIGDSTVQNINQNTTDTSITHTAGTTNDTTSTNSITQVHNTTDSLSQATTTNANNEGNVVTTITTDSTMPLISTTESSLIGNSTVQNIKQDTTEMSITTIAGTTYDTTNTNFITQEQNTIESTITQATKANANNEGIVITITPTTESTMSLISATDSTFIGDSTVQDTTDMYMAIVARTTYDTTHNTIESVSQANTRNTNNDGIVFTTITTDSTKLSISTTESTLIGESALQNNSQNAIDTNITTITGTTYDATNKNTITQVPETIFQATTTSTNNEQIVFTTIATDSTMPSISKTESTLIGNSILQNNSQNTIDKNRTTIAGTTYDASTKTSVTQGPESMSQIAATNTNNEGIVFTTITSDLTIPSIFTTESTLIGDSRVQNNNQNTSDGSITTIAGTLNDSTNYSSSTQEGNTIESITQATIINNTNEGIVFTTIITDLTTLSILTESTLIGNSTVQNNSQNVIDTNITTIAETIYNTTNTQEQIMAESISQSATTNNNKEGIVFTTTATDLTIPSIITTETPFIAGITYGTTNTNPIIQENNTTESATQATLRNNINNKEASVFTITSTGTTIFTGNMGNDLNEETGRYNLAGLTTSLEITTASNIFDDSTTLVSVTKPITISQFIMNNEQINNENRETFAKIESSTINFMDGNILSLSTPITTTRNLNSIHNMPTENGILSNDLVETSTTDINDVTIAEVNTEANTVFIISESRKNTSEESAKQSSLTPGHYRPLQSIEINAGLAIAPTISTPHGSEMFGIVKEAVMEESITDIKTQGSTDTFGNASKQSSIILNISDSIADIRNPTFVTESSKTTNTSFSHSIVNNLEMNTDLNNQDKTLITTLTDTSITTQQNIIDAIASNQESSTNLAMQDISEGAIVDSTYISTPAVNDLSVSYVTKQMGFKQGQKDAVTQETTQVWTNNADTMNQIKYDPITTVQSQVVIKETTERSQIALPLHTDNVITKQGSVNNNVHSKSTVTEPSQIKPVIEPSVDDVNLNVELRRTGDQNLPPPVIETTTILIDLIDNYGELKSIEPSLLNEAFTDTLDSNKVALNQAISQNQPTTIATKNEQTVEDVNKISTNPPNESLRKEFNSSANEVANENDQNINNITHLADRMQDRLSHDYSHYNASKHEAVVTENEQGGLKTKRNTSYIITGASENSATIQSMASDQNVESSINTESIREKGFSDDRATSAKRDEPLNHITVLDENFTQNGAASTPNTINIIELSSDKTINGTSVPNDTSLTTTNVSLVEPQATSMSNDNSLKQSLIVDQKQNQNAAAVTNTENVRTNTTSKTDVSSSIQGSSSSVTQIDDSINHTLNNNEELVQNIKSNFGISDHKPINETSLTSDSISSAIPKDNVLNKLHLIDEQKTLVNNSGTTAVQTDNVTSGIATEIPVTSTQSVNTDSTNRLANVQNLTDTFCFTRNRGRYADREDCTKFYICIGKTDPIVGKCPENTVFSEVKKQCTKNKSHCVRGNEFQCLSEGRFSDILKNNAYYICVKRQNRFYRFKFQCQNGYYLNKITVRCTKGLETINQSSTSVDNSNSEKSASEGVSSKETQKTKNNKDSKKESKSSEEFECQKEGKFADRDNCRKYYVCTKTKKSEFRMRRKSCDSDEVFHKDKKKCVDADSYEC